MTFANFYTPRQSGRGANNSGGSKGWWVAGIIAAVLLLGNSCSSSDSWRMGVDGNGYRVTCMDGTTSLSGGKQGACSQHGGVR